MDKATKTTTEIVNNPITPAAETIEYEALHSVEVSQDTKGVFRVTAKVYDNDPVQAAERAVTAAVKAILKLHDYGLKVAGD